MLSMFSPAVSRPQSSTSSALGGEQFDPLGRRDEQRFERAQLALGRRRVERGEEGAEHAGHHQQHRQRLPEQMARRAASCWRRPRPSSSPATAPTPARPCSFSRCSMIHRW